jgi:ribonuclease P protein component
MLSKELRLANKDYPTILKRGQRTGLGWLGVSIRPSESKNLQVGVIIPASSVKKSTRRNRIKRQIHGVIQKLPNETRSSYRVVIRVFRDPQSDEVMQSGLQALKNTLTNKS